MSDFKDNLRKITSDKASNWSENANDRLSKPWLKHYSSQIARRILSLIEGDKDLNQARLATKAGVTAQQISKIVSGKENMTLETIYKISQALNYELITFPPYKYSRPTNTNPLYMIAIDTNTHLISKENWKDINGILAEPMTIGTAVSINNGAISTFSDYS